MNDDAIFFSAMICLFGAAMLIYIMVYGRKK